MSIIKFESIENKLIKYHNEFVKWYREFYSVKEKDAK
jgi:hypothetical protein